MAIILSLTFFVFPCEFFFHLPHFDVYSYIIKAMRKSENSVIPCSAEIDLTEIPTNGILAEINWISVTRKLGRNLTEIWQKFNGNFNENA